jgi:3',5'-cyclic AMP phosphodiesterase CpdA
MAGEVPVPHRTYVLAHLSDPHVPNRLLASPVALINKRVFGFLSWHLRRARIHRAEVLLALVDDLAHARPDHVAVTGDIVNIALSKEFKRAGQWLETLGEPNDVTVVPGNHDAYVAMSWERSWASWKDFMTSDGNDGSDGGSDAPRAPTNADDGFPILRRRGPLALIGLSTAQPTAPGRASGRVGRAQLDRLAGCLRTAGSAGLFRVVLLHHPPGVHDGPAHKRLTDADRFQEVIAETGAEMILHGHEHRCRFDQLAGPIGPVPVFGVPSASMRPRREGSVAGQYHLHHISERDGSWHVETHIRTFSAQHRRFVESQRRQMQLARIGPTPPLVHSTAARVL